MTIESKDQTSDDVSGSVRETLPTARADVTGGPFLGLRSRLLLLTAAFVLLAELLIFPPSAASQRNAWITEKVQAGEIAAVALEASQMAQLSDELSTRLMNETGMATLAVGKEDMRELIFEPERAISPDKIVLVDRTRDSKVRNIWQTFGHMFAPDGRYVRIISRPVMSDQSNVAEPVTYVDAILPEAPLKKMLWDYSRNIFLLSLLISALTGGLVYLVVYRLLVRPMLRMTGAVSRFAEMPDQMAPFAASGRLDEIGQAEFALQNMQETVSAAFRQKTRLAALGEAVAKINHDLRNSLAVAQLVSGTVKSSDDPRVREAAPRLERALTRAIDLAESTLRYGRIEARPPRMIELGLYDLAEEALREGLAAAPEVDWINEIADDLVIRADPEHLHRIIANLSRNAAQAIAQHGAEDGAGLITLRSVTIDNKFVIEVADNGPGVPESIKARLFKPFSESGSRDGTGLGLAIARELAIAMGGDIALADAKGPGAVFQIRL